MSLCLFFFNLLLLMASCLSPPLCLQFEGGEWVLDKPQFVPAIFLDVTALECQLPLEDSRVPADLDPEAANRPLARWQIKVSQTVQEDISLLFLFSCCSDGGFLLLHCLREKLELCNELHIVKMYQCGGGATILLLMHQFTWRFFSTVHSNQTFADGRYPMMATATVTPRS